MRYCVLFIILLSFTACFSTAKIVDNQLVSNDNDVVNNCIQNLNTDSIYSYILNLENFNSRFALKNNRKDIAIHLVERFQSFGYENVKIDSFYLEIDRHGILHQTWQYNIIATLEGSNDTAPKYIIGAHYDSINYYNDDFDAPGADDNASGVAGVLEIARVLKNNEFKPNSNIVFVCFGSEEIGISGSKHYSKQLVEQNKNVAVMINYDMIAYNPNPNKKWKFTLQKYPNTDSLENKIVDISQKYTVLEHNFARNFLNLSDSYNFAKDGFDVIFIHEYDFNNLLHSQHDKIDNLDMEYCAEIIKLAMIFLIKENT